MRCSNKKAISGTHLLILAACGVFAVGNFARGDAESFEGYAPGTNIIGQVSGLDTWGGYLAANDVAKVINTDAAPGQGTKSLEFDDNTSGDTSFLKWTVANTPFDGSTISVYYKAVGAYSAFYVEPQVDLSGIPALNNSAYVFGFGDSGGYMAEQGSTVTLLQDPSGNYLHYTVGDWYRVDLVDHDNAGQESVDITLTDASTNSLIYSQANLQGYSVGGRDTLDEIDFFNSSDSGQTSHVDGIALNETPAPEPAAVSLMALAGMLTLGRKRIQR